MLQENILKEAQCLNKKWSLMVIGYQALSGEFCSVNGGFSRLRCLMNTLYSLTSMCDHL